MSFKESVEKDLGPSPEDIDEAVGKLTEVYKRLATTKRLNEKGLAMVIQEAMDLLEELIPRAELEEVKGWLVCKGF